MERRYRTGGQDRGRRNRWDGGSDGTERCYAGEYCAGAFYLLRVLLSLPNIYMYEPLSP
jgi:hypothetical protein